MAEYEYRGRNTQTFAKLPGYKNVVAWQVASDLAAMISSLTSGFGPGHYGLANQMRGAAMSISANLAEGYCSGTLRNYIRYCHQARGSLGELGSYILDCERSQLAQGAELQALLKQYSLATLFMDRLIKGLVHKAASQPDSDAYWLKEPPAVYDGDASVAEDIDLPHAEDSATSPAAGPT